MAMKIAVFAHSFDSCWNHGNAHFLRGVLREFARRGHAVLACEPHGSWSRANLVCDHGEDAALAWRRRNPDLPVLRFRGIEEALAACSQADLVLIHEWNDPGLVAAIGRLRETSSFTLFFHDTHHRGVSDPEAMARYDLDHYDGVLAFGAALAEVYERRGWGKRVRVWHEAADITQFKPPDVWTERNGVVWIGNWGDGERTQELDDFLLEPAQRVGASLDIHGVRYPAEALALLEARGACFRGWTPNAAAPEIFARHAATVHVPRRFYRDLLPGIPTIRVFEALASGIPLLSAPWRDDEGLFREGDFIFARNGDEMAQSLRDVLCDEALRRTLAARGRETILARHTCAHRVDELMGFIAELRQMQEIAQ